MKTDETKLVELVSIRVPLGTMAKAEAIAAKVSEYGLVPLANVLRSALQLGLSMMAKHHEEIIVQTSTSTAPGITKLERKTINNGIKKKKGKTSSTRK